MPILHDDKPEEGEVPLNVCTLQLGQLHVLGEAGGQVARGKGQDTVALQLYTLSVCCNTFNYALLRALYSKSK